MVTQLWGLIVPEATINYVKNPRFYKDLTNWSTYNTGTATGTVARDSAWSTRSGFSSKAVKTGGSGYHGQYLQDSAGDISIPPGLGSGDSITASVDLYIPTADDVLLSLTSGNLGADSATSVVSGPFEGRASVTVALTGVPTLLELSITNNVLGDDFTWYIDAVQVETKAYATTYCDGRTPNCTWKGETDASASSRKKTVRGGGRDYNLDDYSVYVNGHAGTGFPPIQHYIQGLALLDGALYRGEKVNPAVIHLSIGLDGSSLTNLHSLRKDLIDLIKPDAVPGTQPFRLYYTGANSSKKIWIDVQYDSGLDVGDFGENFHDDINLRLIAYNPLWYVDYWEAYHITHNTDLTNVNDVMAQEDGVWHNMDQGASHATPFVFTIKKGPDGLIYFGGLFTTIGGVANTSGIAVWDPDAGSFSALGTGVAGGYVLDMDWDAAGNLYIVGTFTSVNAVSNTQGIAKWDGSTWSAMYTTTAPNSLDCVRIDPLTGDIYVGGNIPAGGIDGAGAQGLNYYDVSASSWTILGTSPTDDLNNSVRTIEFDTLGKIFVGGNFTQAGAVSNTRALAYWDRTLSTPGWVEMDGGVTGSIGWPTKLLFGDDGYLYVVGHFLDVGSDTDNTRGVARWDNATWQSLHKGTDNGSVYTIDRTPSGDIYIGGNFTKVSGLDMPERISVFNGSKWSNIEANLPDNALVQAVYYDDERGNLYIGMSGSTTTIAKVSTTNTITYTGSREGYPRITLRRSGGTSLRLRWIKNRETGATLKFNYEMQDGEELVIDLTPGQRSIISSAFGSRWDAISQVSNVHAFTLIPGENEIEFWAEEDGSPTVEAFMEAIPNFWSFDGVAT